MDIAIRNNVNLKPLNTLAVAARCAHYAQLTHAAQLPKLTHFIAQHNSPYRAIGAGSNILFTQDFTGLIIHNAIMGIEIIKQDPQHIWLHIGAGVVWHDVVTYCIKHGYGGIENLSYIPGTAGAAPIQNIGAYGVELKDVFSCLTAFNLNTGEKVIFDQAACQFAYRDSIFKHHNNNHFIITDITLRLYKKPCFKLGYPGLAQQLGDQSINLTTVSEAIINLRKRKIPNPEVLANAGSFFKNPIITQDQLDKLQQKHPNIPNYPASSHVKLSAAWLIEQTGLKGKQHGNTGTYQQHALILVNHGQATGTELYQYAQHIQSCVAKLFDIQLSPEVNIL